MLIAEVKDNVVLHVGVYTRWFTKPPTDAELAAGSYMRVNLFRPHDRLTQKLVQSEPVVEDGWVYTVAVAAMTAEEIQSAKDSAMAQIRGQRNQLLTQTDGTQAVDNPSPKKADWAAYRQQLRDLPATIAAGNIDPRTFSDWPKDPNWQPME